MRATGTVPDLADAEPTAPAIEIRGLTKYYGDLLALDHLDLEVRTGEIVGFLGPNGAGKSTTIRLLLDLIRPDAGSATIRGHDCQIDGVAARSEVGYLPGDVRLYDTWSGRDLVRYAAAFRPAETSDAAVADLAGRLRLNLGRRIRDLSKGNRQKLGLLIALMHDPPVLVLDEPTAGLDPLRQRAVWDLLRERADRGAAVLFSSHVMSEVEEVCDRVAVLRAGRLLAVDSVSGLVAGRPTALSLRFADAPPDLRSLDGVSAWRAAGHGTTFDFTGDPTDLVAALQGRAVVELTARPPRLDDAIVDLYEGA